MAASSAVLSPPQHCTTCDLFRRVLSGPIMCTAGRLTPLSTTLRALYVAAGAMASNVSHAGQGGNWRGDGFTEFKRMFVCLSEEDWLQARGRAAHGTGGISRHILRRQTLPPPHWFWRPYHALRLDADDRLRINPLAAQQLR